MTKKSEKVYDKITTSFGKEEKFLFKWLWDKARTRDVCLTKVVKEMLLEIYKKEQDGK